jgi:2-haloacid dehalogenase
VAPTPLDPARYSVLTFDCFGTLVDWETRMLDYARPILEQHDVHVRDEFILEFFAETEAALEAGPHVNYRIVLENVMSRFGKRLGFTPSGHNLVDFPIAIATSAPFPDTVQALKTLAERYDLVIVSNTDDDLFALTQPLLQVEFAHIVTAKQMKTYKPDRRMFEAAIERCGVPREKILHVAQSLYHDIAPARALGIDAVWIDRRAGKHGGGATRASDARPSWQFPSLAALVDALRVT